MRRTFLSFLLVLPCAVLGVGACGGSAFDGGPGMGTGTGGTGTGGAGTSTGGSGALAGAAGRAAGGSVGVGGSSSNGGATTSGGTGNAAGSGGAVDIAACTSNTDCEVVPVGCCSCGTGPLSNFTAINSKYDDQYGQRCGDIACAPCGPNAFNPNDPTLYYVATCRAGRCAVVDLQATDITACESAADCSLQAGTTCCSGCTGTPVALNTKNEPELASLVCSSGPSACAGCIATYPDYSVACNSGRCGVLLSPCTSAHPCPL